jgi:hypothetical protein
MDLTAIIRKGEKQFVALCPEDTFIAHFEVSLHGETAGTVRA